ncbi:MAG: hypothetical protein ABI324_30635, partial [Ktedonobacteraceae bacterium]
MPFRFLSLRLCFFFLIALLLLSDVLTGWASLIPPAYAAAKPPTPQASMTFQQFLKDGRQDRSTYRGPLRWPQSSPAVPVSKNSQAASSLASLPPSTEPAKMTPIRMSLNAGFLTATAGSTPLDVVGSDQRLEVRLQPGSLDLSHATVSGGSPPSGTLTVQISQVHGHAFAGEAMLGLYQVQILDGQGHPVSGIQVRTPVTFIYHYQIHELAMFDLDADQLSLVWPGLLQAAQQAKQSQTAFAIRLQNNPTAHTLTGQSTVLAAGVFDLSGDPQNASPPHPHMASVGGNAGQMSYGYPIQVAPGPAGFSPQLSLSYSSSGPNERHDSKSTAGNVGDGWSLELGSISVTPYPSTSADPKTWYFLSGVDNISDRLIEETTANQFQTEHTSHLRILKISNPAVSGQSCFDVWDLSGTFYEFGCTPDSLVYRHDATQGTVVYGYNLDRMIAPHNGTGTYKTMLVSYVQDCGTDTSCTITSSTVRDSAIRQIQYGFSSHVNNLDTVVGTVDFLYRGPRTIAINGTNWTTAYGTKYNCSAAPPDGTSTTLRCDDPIARGSVSPPAILSTLSLQTVTSYVGKDDGTGHPDYRYDFSYQDQPYRDCYNINLQQAYCAGEHLLTNVQPTAYQNGTGHALKPLTLGYTQEHDTYSDTTQKFPGSNSQYNAQSYWSYLSSYHDLATGASGTIAYQGALSNTHGTPKTSDGDNRYDPLHCTTYNDCNGSFSYPDDRAWSNQVVTSLTTVGQDSTALPASTTTTYRYRLAKTGSNCPADATGNTDCVGDNWIPANSHGLDQDWMDFYHGEYHGFNVVYTTSPAGDLTVGSYFSTKGWGTYETDGGNYNSGSMYQEDIYQGNAAVDSALVQRTINTYTGPDNNSCNGVVGDTIYSSCIVMMERTRTILYEGTGSGNANAPWSQHDYTYDDFTVANGQIGGYHNLLQEVITASNAPTITKQWTYQPVDQTVNSNEYYDVNKVIHSKITDSSGHVWQCQDTTYDEGRPSGVPSPAAGWTTTVKSYSDCTNPGGTAISTYKGYDAYGNTVSTVDAFAAANPSLYSSHGCTLTT